MKRWLPFLLIALVLATTLLGSVAFYRSKLAQLTSIAANPADQKAGAQPPHVRGAAEARVTLEEFGDFQCPPCGELWPLLGKLEHEYGDKLRVVFRELPLAMHAYADLAARAAEAAGQQNRFWEMYDLLYRFQTVWSKAPDPEAVISMYALSLHLDPQKFRADLASDEVRKRIEADQERATSLGVKSTPTLVLNGTVLPPTSVNEAGLHAAIEAVLSGKQPPSIATPSPASAPTK